MIIYCSDNNLAISVSYYDINYKFALTIPNHHCDLITNVF